MFFPISRVFSRRSWQIVPENKMIDHPLSLSLSHGGERGPYTRYCEVE
jgi:hypothetical protein